MFENGQWDIVEMRPSTGKKKSTRITPKIWVTLPNTLKSSLQISTWQTPNFLKEWRTINAGITSKSKYADYSDSQKTLFLYYLQLEFLSAAASARKAVINVRTGQDWAKKLKNDPDLDIFEKQTNKTVRKESQLQEEHKAHLIENWYFLYVKPQDEQFYFFAFFLEK